jgi:hypothetical protein
VNLDPIIQAQIEGRLVRASVFMRIDGVDPVRVWTGFGDFLMPENAIETADSIYKGVGIIGDLPAMEQLVNGTAQRIEASMSGVSAYVASLADEDASVIRGQQVNFALAFMDETWALIGDPIWVWEGDIDVVKRNMNRTQSGESRTISISIGSLMTGRRRPTFSYWTGPQQRRRSSTDAFCDRTIIYTRNTKLTWPKAS